MERKPLIILTGPTAAGKTKMSVALAKAIGGEIISADSMQVYKHMDIGSAKIREEEKEGIPHYLVDVLEPDEEFHVVRFLSMAKEALKEIYGRGKLPIVAGGTGFYIQALLYDIDFEENKDDKACRVYLEQLAEEKGAAYLHAMLERIDPKAAEDIHENNVKKVIRALEFYKQTGTKISEHNERERKKVSPYHSAYFVLADDREKLYKNIERRVDLMMDKGLVEEVKQLKKNGFTPDMVSMQGLGYKEILRYLNGELTLEEAVYIIKRDTRHFAKRQLTWFRREKNVIWVNKQDFHDNESEILNYMLDVLKEKKIINCAGEVRENES